MPEIFLDTSIGIKRIENSINGEKVRTYLSGQSLFTSTFVLMEFKRTILKDAVSLYTILQEELTLTDAYWRIKNMLNDPATKKEGQRWVLLLGLLGYPRENQKNKAIRSLENLIRKGLILQFLYQIPQIQLLRSNTICSSVDSKPNKTEGKYELNMGCCVDECDIKSTIEANRGVLEGILGRTMGNHEQYFIELSDIINEVLNDVNNMREEYCKRLGDVIVAIDCPNEMELCTSDHHFDIICGAVGKSCYNPLTS